MIPPKAKKQTQELIIHDHKRIDPYFWLNKRENPEVLEYLKAENDYTSEMMKDTEGLQDVLFNEIVSRIKQTDMSVPYFLNGYYYYTRYEEGKEYPVYCRKQGSLDAQEEIMIDVNILAEGHDFFHVSGITVSEDNKLMAYGADTTGRRIYTIHFKNLETEQIIPGNIGGTTGMAYWANDNKTVFYTSKDPETLRPDKIFRYQPGSEEKSVLIYEEKDEIFYTFLYKSRSREYLVIGSSSTLTDEYRILKADNPFGEFSVFQKRERGVEYSIGHKGDKFYIRTNLNAKNFCLMETPVGATARDNWKIVIPHRENVLVESFLNFDHYLVVDERIDGNTNLRIIDSDKNDEHYIKFNEEVYTAWISINPDFSGKLLRIGYSSLTTPISTYEYNMKTRGMKLLKRQEIVGGHNPDDYESKRLYALAGDGKKVAISMVYKKNTPLDGSAPLLLYAYGSYGNTIDPTFGIARLSMLDRGFVYAIAHIRGGEFYGRDWYDDGKLLNKKNTFTDYIACAQYLVDQKITQTDRLMAMGGSAGGLLMGVVVNERPDLFKGVIAAVPFVDVVTTMLDDDIPLTTGEYDEWGNPNDKKYYEYILSYSPYDNVKPHDYPNMLVTAGLHDSQVQYWEPAKWVAKLRDIKTDDNLLLLYTNMDAGHGGASGRFKQHKETALEYAFLLKLVGIKN
ncbi:MAG: S9 family peptidase [Bacteroidales bacterium]|nr:S9 family peptidase [Bacteroidales bacterium]